MADDAVIGEPVSILLLGLPGNREKNRDPLSAGPVTGSHKLAYYQHFSASTDQKFGKEQGDNRTATGAGFS